MAITATCQQCGKQYRVGDQLAGKKAKCKNCGGVFAIPLPEAPAEEMLDFSAVAELERPVAAAAGAAPARRRAAEPAAQPVAEAEAPKESASNNAFYALRALLVVAAVIAVVALTMKFYIDSAKSYAASAKNYVRERGGPGMLGQPIKRDAKGNPIMLKPMRGQKIGDDVWLEVKVEAPETLRAEAERSLVQYIKEALKDGKLYTDDEGRTQVVAIWRKEGTEEVTIPTPEGQIVKVTIPRIVHDVTVCDDAGEMICGETGALLFTASDLSVLKPPPGQTWETSVEAYSWRTAADRARMPNFVSRKQFN